MTKNKDKKYSIDDLRKLPADARLLAVGIMIANELNALNKRLKNLESNK